MAVRVLVWNLFHGRALPAAGRPLYDEFAARIAAWPWDVALLQEVPPWWPARLARDSHAEQRNALTSRNALRPLRRALAERWPDLIKSNGGGANAILARRPIVAYRAVRLRRWPERRVAQLVRLDTGACVVNLHASTRPPLARAELGRAWELALAWAGTAPLIVAGDLNLRDPQAPSAAVAHAAASDVDHVFTIGMRRVGDLSQPGREFDDQGGSRLLSDHAALLVTLDGGG